MLSGKGVVHAGTGWPDALSGTFVMAAEGEKLTFAAAVPDGNYSAYLVSGPIYRRSPASRTFRLLVNGKPMVDQSPTPEEFYSEKHLYRFLSVDHDGDPASLWPDYISRMYPSHRLTVKVTDGTVRVEAVNHFVSALVLVPGKVSPDFGAPIERSRREVFEKTLPVVKRAWPARAQGEALALAWVPTDGERVWPWSQPKRQKTPAVSLAAAPGQAIHFRLGLDHVSGERVESRSRATERRQVRHPGSTAALRWRRCLGDVPRAWQQCKDTAQGRTRCLWFRVEVPSTLKPGKYEGAIRAEGKRVALKVPVTLEVLPITLEEVLPLSLGMYYGPRPLAGIDEVKQRALYKGQLHFMRSLGMTASPVGSGTVTGLRQAVRRVCASTRRSSSWAAR